MLEVKEKVHYFEEADYMNNYSGWIYYEACEQINAYKRQLSGNNDLTGEEKRKVAALSLLEQLGYPMGNIGTYLYVTVIAEIMYKFENSNKDNFVENGKQILKEINNPFSSFYVLLARENLDMGVKSFHEAINDAIENVDLTRVSGGLSYDIYNGLPDEVSVSENAFILASYLLNRTAKKEAKMPYIKTIYER